MSEARIYPVRNQTYTLEEITKLYLGDSPCLRIFHENHWIPVQYDLGIDEICEKNALLANSRWVYIQTTDESIPVFNYAQDNDFPLTQIVTIERNHPMNREGGHWVCFQGFHQEEITGDLMPMYHATHYARAWKEAHAENAEWDQRAVAEKQKSIEIPDKDTDFSFKKVMESIINPTIPSYTAEELATDDAKAQHYLSTRMSDTTKFEGMTVLIWERVNMVSKKAKLYEVGYVHKHAGWYNWGKLVWDDKKKTPVR
jgi:hypothetical protein